MTGKVCAKCRIELRPKRNGIIAIEMADFGPYKIWYADAWVCPQCYSKVVLGFASRPAYELYQPEFADALALARQEPDTIEFWMDQKQKELARH